VRCRVWLLISFGGIGLLSMEDCAPSIFIGNWVLVALYLYSRFHIFDRPILEEYVSQVEGGSHLFYSCLHVAQDDILPTTREVHPFFESLIVTNTLGLWAYLIDIHHNTSLRFILKDDSSSSTFRVYICSHVGKGAGLWLVIRPSIHLVHITHSTFISSLCFCLDLIQP
jgi:hypothetical protein